MNTKPVGKHVTLRHVLRNVKRRIGVYRAAKNNGPRDPFLRMISRERQKGMTGNITRKEVEKIVYGHMLNKTITNVLRRINIINRARRARIREVATRIYFLNQELYEVAYSKKGTLHEKDAELKRIKKAYFEDSTVLERLLGAKSAEFNELMLIHIGKWAEI